MVRNGAGEGRQGHMVATELRLHSGANKSHGRVLNIRVTWSDLDFLEANSESKCSSQWLCDLVFPFRSGNSENKDFVSFTAGPSEPRLVPAIYISTLLQVNCRCCKE